MIDRDAGLKVGQEEAVAFLAPARYTDRQNGPEGNIGYLFQARLLCPISPWLTMLRRSLGIPADA